jgi:uncharacterized protein YegL
MPVKTNEPTRRLFPVYFLIDASGSMREDGKWKVLNDLLAQCLGQLKEKPDPDFEIVVTIVVMRGGGVAVEHSFEPVDKLILRDIDTSGVSNYSVGLEKIADLIDDASFPENAHQPCIVLVGDGHVDDAFEVVLNKTLQRKNFRVAARLVVEIGNDFNSADLRAFVSSPNNFYSVLDIATMPLFYMRLASSISSHASLSRSRRLLID